MDPLVALTDRDGVATFGHLVKAGVRPVELGRAVETGAVLRPYRGVYLMPEVWSPLGAAKRLGGTVSHTTAADFYGLELLRADPLHHVTVPRARKKVRVGGVRIHRRDLGRGDLIAAQPVTSVERTCLDCFRLLPLRDAVALGDSALRKRRVTRDQLIAAACGLRGAGSAAARAAASLLDPKSESVLESAGRVEMHLAGLPAPETQVVVQTPLGQRRLDFLFRQAGVGVETDGFETHGLTRAALLSDCERHNGYALGGLIVLRFGFEHVMRMPTFFTDTVRLALDLAGSLREVPQCTRCGGLAITRAA
jgi:very-short-patch-repair endonuclease